MVIIPTFNEANTVVNVALEVISAGYEVLVVDDGSTDSTSELLIESNVMHTRHEVNQGQGKALSTGMQYAIERGYDIVVHFDADGQHQVKDICKMIQPLYDNKCNVVLGSRFLNSPFKSSMSLQKRLILNVGRYIEYLFTGILLTDVHNGFRALNYKAFSTIKITIPRMAHASQIIQEIKRLNLLYQEVAVDILYFEQKHKKAQSFSHAFKIVFALLREKWKNV